MFNIDLKGNQSLSSLSLIYKSKLLLFNYIIGPLTIAALVIFIDI